MKQNINIRVYMKKQRYGFDSFMFFLCGDNILYGNKKKRCMAIIMTALILSFSTGCMHDDPTIEKSEALMASQIKENSDILAEKQKQRIRSLEILNKKKIDIQPVLPQYNALEDHNISLSMVDESLETVLYLIADTVGMNLILDPQIRSQQNRVTLNFQDVPAKTVLTELTNQFNLDYTIDGNIIRINTTAEQFFSLNFLDTNVQLAFSVGGDVLGSGGEENVSGLSGSITMQGTSAEQSNPYTILLEMLKTIKSENGTLSINQLSGSLYIKDKPSIVKTAGKIIHQFKEMLSRQVLIEARIIEVTLSSGFEYGIDWSLLEADIDVDSIQLSQAAWDLTTGLVLQGYNSSFTFNSVISALKTFGDVKIVSNPTLRVKHGKSALISVGDSIAYKKSVTVTTETTDAGITESTEVEVSTVFDGLLLGVIPFIEEYGKINLLINPVKSDVDTQSIEKPENVGGGVTISLPKIGIKEISTTISINDGDTIVLGGLISKENVKKDKDVPGISRIPVLGYFFKNNYIAEERKELVIILNVTVI